MASTKPIIMGIARVARNERYQINILSLQRQKGKKKFMSTSNEILVSCWGTIAHYSINLRFCKYTK